jgi:hypothetical protein
MRVIGMSCRFTTRILDTHAANSVMSRRYIAGTARLCAAPQRQASALAFGRADCVSERTNCATRQCDFAGTFTRGCSLKDRPTETNPMPTEPRAGSSRTKKNCCTLRATCHGGYRGHRDATGAPRDSLVLGESRSAYRRSSVLARRAPRFRRRSGARRLARRGEGSGRGTRNQADTPRSRVKPSVADDSAA